MNGRIIVDNETGLLATVFKGVVGRERVEKAFRLHMIEELEPEGAKSMSAEKRLVIVGSSITPLGVKVAMEMQRDHKIPVTLFSLRQATQKSK